MYDDDEEREITLFHGTSLDKARFISKHKFEKNFVLWLTHDGEVARIFARRYCSKQGKGTPALVSVTLYESDLKQWQRSGLVTNPPFDSSDPKEFRTAAQLKFSPTAVTRLNGLAFWDETKIIQLQGEKLG